MDEPVLGGLGRQETLAALEQSVLREIREGCTQIELTVHWAVQNPGEAVQSGVVPGLERRIRLGGAGTPEVAEFAPVELGAVLGLADWQARDLVADSLDLRYRLPRLWELVLEGRVHAWRARRIASRTRELSVDAAAQVDADVWESVESMPWQRFSDYLESRILLADPGRAIRLAEKAKRDRYVEVSRRPRHGTKTIRMRVDAADANLFEDSIARTSAILEAADRAGESIPGVGDRESESTQEFRAQSVGVLAQPLLAAQVLAGSGEIGEPLQELVELDEETRRPVVTPRPDDPLGGPVPRSVSEWLLKADLSKLLPRAILHVHIAEETLRSGLGICRVEDVGPMIAEQVRRWLGSGVQLRVQPIIDANDLTPTDTYEVPARMRESIFARSPASCFPWSTTVSRRTDLDHTVPYRSAGPPGQTWVGNLGPLGRHEHRVRTHGGWQVCQPAPGTYLWRSPYGYVYVVNQTGTHALGCNEFTRTIWSATSSARSSGPPQRSEPSPAELRLRAFIHDLDIGIGADTRSWRHAPG
ncbi:hypothetical protein GCM10011575_41180 [Microlunatus endophyticus]|uniref:DUF222 domain-containing protein n=1 Tax=Microlunatus endophyticus TaxID=1716077 RepID=A0A917W8X2_9ACTN|nr:DUF222 domain-containing protein [Microlunatus endophyticus]GGL78579.1 hypothetical protein GCM10011575_41180 [Microlunatus endophyticus]